ncbi:MAG: cytidylate kinase family protein, partial [bacterium]|nr:cytidylate kinase family protein [bacterium]
MIITISGRPGSGKSTVGKMLAKKLGYNFYSMGDLRGKMAMERGITINELNEIGKREGWTDREPDEYQKKLGKTEDNFVIDSRLGFYFIPHSFKVFIEVDSKIGAERVFKNQRPDEKPITDIKEMQTAFESRAKQDDERYQKYYN